MKNEFIDLNKNLQFYNTPVNTINRMIELIDFDLNDKDILEPSAGQGSLLLELQKKYINCNYYYCEYLQENVDNFKAQGQYICKDFLKIQEYTDKKFDFIIANPPFSKNQDIEHFIQMIKVLKMGGHIISVLSNTWRKQNNKKTQSFKELLKHNKVELIELDNEGFKNIGLNINTCILKFTKENNLLSYDYDFSIKQEDFEPEPVCIEDFCKTIFDYEIFEKGQKDKDFQEIMNKKVKASDVYFDILINNLRGNNEFIQR